MPPTMSQSRSEPTSCGASTRSGTSLIPGSTVNGCPPKYASAMPSSVCCTVGTTLEMATPRIFCCSMPRVASRVWMKTPYSSAVCSRRVVSRHETRSFESWQTPILKFVLPTSMSRSMVSLRRHFARQNPHRLAGIGAEHERTVRSQVYRHTLDPAGPPGPPTDGPGPGEPGLADGFEAAREELPVSQVERRPHRVEDRLHLERRAGCQPERRRRLADLVREGRLVDVDAYPQDHAEEGAGRVGRGLGENARNLAPVHEHVVGPADRGGHCRHLSERVDDGDGGHEREPRRRAGRDARVKDDGHEEILSRTVEPSATAPPPALGLVRRGDHDALRHPRRGQPRGLGLRRGDRTQPVAGVAEPLGGRDRCHSRAARLWVSLPTISCCSSRRSRSRATTSAGARSTKSRRASLPARNSISLRARSISLVRRARSAATSTTPWR